MLLKYQELIVIERTSNLPGNETVHLFICKLGKHPPMYRAAKTTSQRCEATVTRRAASADQPPISSITSTGHGVDETHSFCSVTRSEQLNRHENARGVLLDIASKSKRVLTGKTLGALRITPLQCLNDGDVVDHRLVNAIVVADCNLPNAAHVLDQILRHRREQLGPAQPNESLMEIDIGA